MLQTSETHVLSAIICSRSVTQNNLQQVRA